MSAAFRSVLGDFRKVSTDYLVGVLVTAAANDGYTRHWHAQTAAWRDQVDILKVAAEEAILANAAAADWGIALEYNIPRRSRRIDAVVIASGALVVLEFKIGANSFDSGGVWQVEDYCLDLRDFHEASRGRQIFPALVASAACDPTMWRWPTWQGTVHVATVARIGPGGVAPLFLRAAERALELGLEPLDVVAWDSSPYLPAVSIIEAAEAIFAGHQVREIAHAAADTLNGATSTIVEAVKRARSERQRVVCFVTGVPGAGKTLVGLTLAHDPALRVDGQPGAVFLSGNGPLVKVVREALVRDVRRRKDASRDAGRRVSTFVQSVHEFLEEHGMKHVDRPPPEHIVVFDEAQRAWSAAQMQRKRGVPASEPAMMLDVMERCSEWSVIVALVGGGQEIHSGEAGLSEWGRALSGRSADWTVMASREVLDGRSSSLAGARLFTEPGPLAVRTEAADTLHLPVSLRSFRARVVTEWVDAVLAGDAKAAGQLLSPNLEFPLVLTRSLSTARAWLRARAVEEDRFSVAGLVASSGALRLRAHGIELSSGFRRSYPFEEWFLAGPRDVRSASRLEVAATEFECQGLELDWTGVCWGDDLTYDTQNQRWALRKFYGTNWRNISNVAERQYLVNKYRVLLTRARRGMVIWVPRGDPDDHSRDPVALNQTAEFLESCAVGSLEEPSA